MLSGARYRARTEPGKTRTSVRGGQFERSCGATTGFSTQASIGKANGGTSNGPGNIFVATTGVGPSGPGGGPELRVRWIDSRTVERSHHRDAQISLAKPSQDGITIRYVTSLIASSIVRKLWRAYCSTGRFGARVGRPYSSTNFVAESLKTCDWSVSSESAEHC